MTILKAIAEFETTLANGISKTSTTAKLLSNLTKDFDGATIPNGDYGFVLDERNGNREYAIGTVSGFDITWVKRGLSYIDGDTVKTGNQFPHRKGASIKMTSFPILVRMLEQLNGVIPLDDIPKLPTARSITDPRHIVDKEFAEGLANAGAANSSTTVKGIVEEATQAEIDADTAAGATGARLSINPSSLVLSKYGTRLPTANEKSALPGSSGAAGSLNKYLTEDDATVYGGGVTQQAQNATQAVGEVDATTKANKICQTFIPTLSSQIAIYLNKQANTGTNAGDVIIEFFAVDGSNNPTGAALATTTITAATWNAYPTGNNYITIAYTFTIGTTYAMVVRQSTADNSNHINLGYQNTDVYANGTLKRYNVTDGWVAITGDLTFSLFGTVNSKTVRRTGTGTIYMAAAPVANTDVPNKLYVDTQISSIPLIQQQIGAETASGGSSGTKCATDSTGTVMVLIQRLAGGWNITRYTTDNGIWYRTHSVTLSWGGSNNNSVTILGSYVYVYGIDTSGPTVKVARFNIADLTSETNMTISGGTPSATDAARAIFTDGTLVYLSDPAGAGQARRYSLSGTTLTYQATITYTSLGFDGGFYCDGTYLYNTRITTGTNVEIVKYTLATGGAALSTTNRDFNGVFTGGLAIGIIPFTSAKFWIVMHGTIDAIKTMMTQLITKP